MNRRALFVALGVFAIGGGLIAWGWRLQGTHQFAPALLLELGASFLLVVPLLVFERLLSGRIREARETVREEVNAVRSEVREASRRLDELDQVYEERQAQARVNDVDAVEAVRRDVSLENLHDLLTRASEQKAISARGVRVPLDPLSDRVRFRLAYVAGQTDEKQEPVIWIDHEDATGAVVGGSVIWSAGEPIEEIWQRLVEATQSRNRYPGDGILVPGKVIGSLLDTVARALVTKTSPRGSIDVGPVIEFLGDWALTEQGVEHVEEPPYSIPIQRLFDDNYLDDSMQEKMWVDRSSYADAARLARAYFRRARDRRRRLGER